jgi:type I restriction enzyme R subunit
MSHLCPNCGQRPCVCERPPKLCPVCGQDPCVCEEPPKKKIKIKLRDGKEREIKHMISTSFWGADGKPISAEEFMNNMFGALPEYFKSEDELRKIWSDPVTRKAFLEKLEASGYGREELSDLQKLVDAENSDLFDVLAYVSFAITPISRTDRVAKAQRAILTNLDDNQKEFIMFVLDKYIDKGVEELDEWILPTLLNLKYDTVDDAKRTLGDVNRIRSTFFDLQKHLYADYKDNQQQQYATV